MYTGSGYVVYFAVVREVLLPNDITQFADLLKVNTSDSGFRKIVPEMTYNVSSGTLSLYTTWISK